MRVLAGTARGVPLATVPGGTTRPILDRVKKSLFSILETSTLIQDARVADLYAGAGTQGIEALSRGAEFCLFAEMSAPAVALLKQNLAKTRLAEKADVRQGRVGAILTQCGVEGNAEARFDLILYDPPFQFSREDRSEAEAEMSRAGQLLFPKNGRLVLRFERKVEPPAPPGLALVRHWTDGPHAFAFYGVA